MFCRHLCSCQCCPHLFSAPLTDREFEAHLSAHMPAPALMGSPATHVEIVCVPHVCAQVIALYASHEARDVSARDDADFSRICDNPIALPEGLACVSHVCVQVMPLHALPEARDVSAHNDAAVSGICDNPPTLPDGRAVCVPLHMHAGGCAVRIARGKGCKCARRRCCLWHL